jgi:hypothetical protein
MAAALFNPAAAPATAGSGLRRAGSGVVPTPAAPAVTAPAALPQRMPFVPAAAPAASWVRDRERETKGDRVMREKMRD